tara:strand:+ start:382 stop:1728 length:1347 start_codon:yes stop_codon:yes gene_type:complete
MKKNVIWWPFIEHKELSDKFGGYEYTEYSRKTWEYWCEKNDVLFVPFTEPVEKDLFRFRPNWQKAIFCFDELERMGIEYDQVALVDSSFMVRWDTPNFFEMTDRRFTAFRDMDNMRWIYESIQGYKDIFNGFELDQSKYVNSGFIIFNEDHKELMQGFKSFYLENIDEFIELQDTKVRKGNEQTPLNYWLQKNNVDVNIDLPLPFKLTHLQRKDMFSHNWALKEDTTPYYIKYGYNFSFNGLPKDKRNEIMKQTWELIKHNYVDVLDKVKHKDEAKYTTSRKFKEDILNHFDDYKDKTILEIGCCQGDTTRVYAECFKEVIALDIDEWNINQAKQKCSDVDNVSFLCSDIYKVKWDFPQVDVVVIDAGHQAFQVRQDIDKVIDYFGDVEIIIDDYGNPKVDVRNAVNEAVLSQKLIINKKIGETTGFKTINNVIFNDREGIICNSKKY